LPWKISVKGGACAIAPHRASDGALGCALDGDLCAATGCRARGGQPPASRAQSPRVRYGSNRLAAGAGEAETTPIQLRPGLLTWADGWWVVGLRGLEPRTSSLSGIIGHGCYVLRPRSAGLSVCPPVTVTNPDRPPDRARVGHGLCGQPGLTGSGRHRYSYGRFGRATHTSTCMPPMLRLCQVWL
jgi:hypothetical protein